VTRLDDWQNPAGTRFGAAHPHQIIVFVFVQTEQFAAIGTTHDEDTVVPHLTPFGDVAVESFRTEVGEDLTDGG
ncbi:MAG TPA: hypothetical protein VHV31_01430, partial [Nitrolancea sp.]|nr:hypothetical protein [Nitrolancea sp.]